MDVFIKYIVLVLCVNCVFSLNDDGSELEAKTPKYLDEKIPWQVRIAREISHNDSPDTELPAQDLTAQVTSSKNPVDLEKLQPQRRLIRATDARGKSIATIEMSVSMGGMEDLLEPQFSGYIPAEGYVAYKAANGSLKIHRTPATFFDARLSCYDEGAELASPESPALLEAMSAALLTSRQPPLHIFTGVNDLLSKGFFTSLRGTPLSAMPVQWSSREPDNVSHFGNCIVMQRDGPLLDSKCDDMYPYICYKKQKVNQTDLCGTSDTEYVVDKLTKSCYKIHSQFVSWQEAYASCAREGAYLAIPNSEYEAKTLARMIRTEWIWAHIGFSYWREDLWMTIHGESVSEAGFDTWVPGEPNDYMEERCGCIAADLPALVDIDCLDHARPFICESVSEAGFDTWVPGEPNDYMEERCGCIAVDLPA